MTYTKIVTVWEVTPWVQNYSIELFAQVNYIKAKVKMQLDASYWWATQKM